MKWSTLPPRSRAIDLVGTAVGAAAAMAAAALLASMGAEVGGSDGPTPRSMILKGLGAIAALTAALGLTAKLLRREEERQARGRVVVLGAGEPGIRSALALALGCLALALMLMAALEVGAAAIYSGENDVSATSGQSALELARESRSRDDAEGDDGPMGSGSQGGIIRAGPIGPNDHTEGSQSNSNGARLGDLLSDEPILRATSPKPLPRATVHLRGFVLDRYGSDGTLQQRRATAPATHRADADGWIQAPQAMGAEPRLDVPIELQLELLTPGRGVVFAPAELLAVGTQRATYDPSAALWITVPATESSYRLRSSLPFFTVEQLLPQAARGSLPSSDSVSLPAAPKGTRRAYALRSLQAYADSLTAGSTSDLEEVIAVVSHLRDTFGYELFDAGMLSPQQCVELVERSSGSCTHFASLATVLLRSRGIPTRIAVGYVARESLPPEEGSGWLVRARDGHAWIEVHFEGYGWLAFDPTPGDPTVGGVNVGWTPLAESDPGVSRWLNSRTNSRGPVGEGPRTSALGSWIAGAIASTFQDLGGQVGSARSSAAAIFLAAALLAAWAWRRRARARGAGRPDAGSAQTADSTIAPLERPETWPTGREAQAELLAAREFMAALTERGLIQGPTRTPSAFARDVEAQHPESAGVAAAVRALLRRASTRAQLTEDELQGLTKLSTRLRSGPEKLESE